ncbi:helix-turn-helix domain-containing protein [Ensifer sp. ENS11]|uniref:helix-turn-helix domain-containing protein n=1 Tax=Ensifer sp. ENS11 TaxID=2769291 RepID=UPI00178437B8|nr:helix-turn-helix transcriptional regulator [Ensifer sp. ENS11]MBD9488074.1 helix-turn-helix transcriptional regulator [Ensifer sp. ENS11]
MDTRTRIAWNLRHIRSSKKITQEHLAVDANVDRTAISGIERGEYNPSVELLDRLVAALGVDISELFVNRPDSAPAPDPIKAGRKPK